VVIPGLCRGSVYRASVTLVDAAGRRADWGLSDGRTLWRNRIDVPGFEVRVHYRVDLDAEPETYVEELAFTLDRRVGRLLTFGDARRCDADGSVSIAGEGTFELVAHPAFEFSYRLQQGYQRTGAYCDPLPDASSGERRATRIPFDFTDLITGERGQVGVAIDEWNGLEIRLWSTAGIDYGEPD